MADPTDRPSQPSNLLALAKLLEDLVIDYAT